MSACRYLVLAIGLAAAAAHAAPPAGNPDHNGGDCQLNSFTVANGGITVSYDPFDATFTPAPIQLTSTGTGDCAGEQARLKIDADLSNPTALHGNNIDIRSATDSLAARLTGSNGMPITSLDSNSVNSPLMLGAGGTINGSINLNVDPGQRVPPGTYTVRLVASLETGRGNDRGSPISSAFNVTVIVRPAVGLAAGSDTLINLGEIHTGSTAAHDVSFRAYANTPYRLRFVSDNDFNLTLNGRSGAPNIAYEPVLGGQVVNPDARGVGFDEPGQRGFREHLLNVMVPAVPPRPAGVYRDYITIEIAADVSG